MGSGFQRRSSYHNLRRMESSPPDFPRAEVAGREQQGSSTSGCSSGGSSPRSFLLGLSASAKRSTNSTALGLLTSVVAVTVIISFAVYNAANLGLRSVSTSYVHVNYMPNLVNAGFFHSDLQESDSVTRASMQTSDQEFVRVGVKLRRGTGLLRAVGRRAKPEVVAPRWPPETPNWELCTSRDDPAKITSTGTVLGYFSMYLRCPAAPEYTPTLSFAPPVVRDHSVNQAGREHTGPDLLIGIFSGCADRTRRDAVRNTWYRCGQACLRPGCVCLVHIQPLMHLTLATCRLRHSTDALVKVLFVMSNDCQNVVESEAAEHGDLFFSNVRESYYTLTPKVRWDAALPCPLVSFANTTCKLPV